MGDRCQEVLNILRQHQEDWSQRFAVKALGLFGSVARGEEAPDSDVDIWVQFDRLQPYAMVHLKHELEELLQQPVDLVRLRDAMNPDLRRQIEQDAIALNA